MKQREKIAERKDEILRKKELFILDNSLRESTVGQLRGHTIENKWKIYEEVSAMLDYFLEAYYTVTNVYDCNGKNIL